MISIRVAWVWLVLGIIGCAPQPSDRPSTPWDAGTGGGVGGVGAAGGGMGGWGGGAPWGGGGMAGGSFGSSTGGNGGTGVVTGGAQDFSVVRALVDAGQVPTPSQLITEGLFAEHDLPIRLTPCTRLLCLDSAEATTAAADGGLEHWVQLGMTSNVDAATFHRPPLDVAVVIDRSCSMMDAQKLVSVKAAVTHLVDLLDENDTLAVVQFDDSVQVLRARAAVADAAAVKALVQGITIGGATCIECGLSQGFSQLATAAATSSRERRVILLTDAMPNVGGTSPNDFLPMVRSNAAAGRHLTTYGVGLDFGVDLISKLAAVRGANFVFLDAARIANAFDQDFDFVVTPLAYDLHLELVPATGTSLVAMYGMPGVAPRAASVTSTVGTLFLSRSSTGGALVARLEGALAPGASIAQLALSYETVDTGVVSSSFEAFSPLDPPPAFGEPGVQKTVALARYVDLMREACRAWHAADVATARRVGDEMVAVLVEAQMATGDADLAREALFGQRLRDLFGP